MPAIITGAPTNHGYVENFRSAVDKWYGLARASRYVVMIQAPKIMLGNSLIPSEFLGSGGVLDDLSFLCESAELPSRGFTSTDLRYYGPQFKIPFQAVYEDLNLTFLCRDALLERELFDTWMELINPTTTFDFNYRDDYATSITTYQMSDLAHQPRYKIVYEKAYPILLTAQPMTWMEDNFLRLTITFHFLKWTRQASMNLIDPLAVAFKFAGSDVDYVTGSPLPGNINQLRTTGLPVGGSIPPGGPNITVLPNPNLP